MLRTFSTENDAIAVIRPTQSQMQLMCGTDWFKKILLATHGKHLHARYNHNQWRMKNKIRVSSSWQCTNFKGEHDFRLLPQSR
jgi:hypothetical protein